MTSPSSNSLSGPVTLLSAVEQLALLRAKKISPLELAEEHIRQIERLNPHLRAFADFDAERVRTQARTAEKSSAHGPLFGLPMTIKSSIAVAGHRCENGSLLQRGHIPTEDAVAVAQLRKAGAIILGTTNCPEFLMAYETDNLLYGRTVNPWDSAAPLAVPAAVNPLPSPPDSPPQDWAATAAAPCACLLTSPASAR